MYLRIFSIPEGDYLSSVVPNLTIVTEEISPVTINQIDNGSFRNISAYVSVLDTNGTPIGGLTASNFHLIEDQSCHPSFTVTPLSPSQAQISFAMLSDLQFEHERDQHQ